MISSIKEWNRKRKWRRRARKAEDRKARLLSFGKYAFGILVDTRQGLFVVDPEDDFVSRKLLQLGEYGQKELRQCLSLVNESSRVLLIGAHIGAIVVPLSKHCKSVIAIEANPYTFRFLTSNLLLNDCRNVTALNFAANDEPCQIEFILSRDNSGGSKRLPRKDDISYWYDNPEVALVDAHPLDDKLGGEAFDLVFMDIEGSEYYALRGMNLILEQTRTLVMEFIPHHIDKVAGVSITQFIALIQPHFSNMYIPSLNEFVPGERIAEVLESMYRRGKSDEGIIFSKVPLPDSLTAG